MYSGENPYYRVLETSEREHKKFKIKIKTIVSPILIAIIKRFRKRLRHVNI